MKSNKEQIEYKHLAKLRIRLNKIFKECPDPRLVHRMKCLTSNKEKWENFCDTLYSIIYSVNGKSPDEKYDVCIAIAIEIFFLDLNCSPTLFRKWLLQKKFDIAEHKVGISKDLEDRKRVQTKNNLPNIKKEPSYKLKKEVPLNITQYKIKYRELRSQIKRDYDSLEVSNDLPYLIFKLVSKHVDLLKKCWPIGNDGKLLTKWLTKISNVLNDPDQKDKLNDTSKDLLKDGIRSNLYSELILYALNKARLMLGELVNENKILIKKLKAELNQKDKKIHNNALEIDQYQECSKKNKVLTTELKKTNNELLKKYEQYRENDRIKDIELDNLNGKITTLKKVLHRGFCAASGLKKELKYQCTKNKNLYNKIYNMEVKYQKALTCNNKELNKIRLENKQLCKRNGEWRRKYNKLYDEYVNQYKKSERKICELNRKLQDSKNDCNNLKIELKEYKKIIDNIFNVGKGICKPNNGLKPPMLRINNGTTKENPPSLSKNMPKKPPKPNDSGLLGDFLMTNTKSSENNNSIFCLGGKNQLNTSSIRTQKKTIVNSKPSQ